MKALILAAGQGTRLRPYSEAIPKALFPIAGRPVLDKTITYLQSAGCEAIIINTHHRASEIDAFLSRQSYDIPVHTRYEPELLGTGGSIKNAADFWDDRPFIVINSDILTDIDLNEVYDFHLQHHHPVTLVVCDDAEFNTVSVGDDGNVTDFEPASTAHPKGESRLTFTGIQVVNPGVLQVIPEKIFSSSIDAYRKLMSRGKRIKTFVPERGRWKDIGTPARYKDAAFNQMAPEAFHRAFPDGIETAIDRTRLAGDGSDRIWYRLTSGNHTLILADHGIRLGSEPLEVDSFVSIGSHLKKRGLPIPTIHGSDTFSGLVFMEDAGDTNLQDVVRHAGNETIIATTYQSVIQLLIGMSQSGAIDFDPSWGYQSPVYDKALILERECRYFVDAFLKRYLGWDPAFEDLVHEFAVIADRALEFAVDGFMHRDFQSRNIMVKDNAFTVIDFQAGRIGPLQYDLASLLIDPYVNLPHALQDQLLVYCTEQLSSFTATTPTDFARSYRYCAIARNLQILGAYGYLTRVKGKSHFEGYIPAAINTLKHQFLSLGDNDFPKVKAIVDRIKKPL
ncbi:MAG: sugar phosphate nucleotidyltransferase [Desulfobacterales bacterium]